MFCHSVLFYRFARTIPQKICAVLKVLSVFQEVLPLVGYV